MTVVGENLTLPPWRSNLDQRWASLERRPGPIRSEAG
jgi:hypothetical protein